MSLPDSPAAARSTGCCACVTDCCACAATPKLAISGIITVVRRTNSLIPSSRSDQPGFDGRWLTSSLRKLYGEPHFASWNVTHKHKTTDKTADQRQRSNRRRYHPISKPKGLGPEMPIRWTRFQHILKAAKNQQRWHRWPSHSVSSSARLQYATICRRIFSYD
jgi:hypothetical protein